MPSPNMPETNHIKATTTAAETVRPDTTSDPEASAKAARRKQTDEFRTWINTTKTYRRKLIQNWTVNIDYRRGKPFASQSDEDQVSVNMDWGLTKEKQAALFSQVPEARINHHPDTIAAGPWVGKFQSKLNDTLLTSGVEAVFEECLPDVINAAGVGIALVSYESITTDKQVPKNDYSMYPKEIQDEVKQSNTLAGKPIEMDTIPQVVDYRYVIERISPSDFLWPLGFMQSNFERARWLGRSGRIPWAEALRRFKQLKASDRELVSDYRSTMDSVTQDLETNLQEELVAFDEIFYYEFNFDEDAKNYKAIHHLVFIEGKTDPVIDEPWKGQKINPDTGEIIGAMKLPIRVLTLSYITDEAIPPSDSAIGRPQVNEINKSRTQIIKQRERNIPVRWFDVNRVDPTIQQSLMRGTWQNMIPVQGEGSRVIGEVAKSNHPVENFRFDEVAKNDLHESWTLGPNQLGSGTAVETKGESQNIENNFQTRTGKDRAKVASFFIGIAEVLGGLICLYSDPQLFGEGFNPSFSQALSVSILADSTVLVDSNQRLKRLNDFINTYAKSGFVAIEPCLREVAQLIGLDPNTVIQAPQPKHPVEPNISLRLTGTEDMMNPLTLAFLINSGQAPTPELIEQAKQLIQMAVEFPRPPAPPALGPDGQPIPPQAAPGGALPPGVVPPSGGPVPLPQPPPAAVGDAHPNATILPTIGKRSESGGIQ